MRRNSILLCFFILFSFHGLCQWNTGIKSGFFTVAELESLASQQYNSFLAANTVLDSAQDKDAEMVQKVGQRIVAAVKSYYTQKRRSQELKGFTWQINLVNKKDVNAYCLPGARLVIGTGMLEWAQNEGSLAVVIAHEIGHILAGHGEERLDDALKEFAGSKKLGELLSARPNDAKDIFLAAYGAGNNVGLLNPFSLEHEMEADKLGMMFAGLAGYNPREAIVFWERMGRLARSARQPVLMSAHRGDNARIDQMEEIVDSMVKNYYRPVKS